MGMINLLQVVSGMGDRYVLHQRSNHQWSYDKLLTLQLQEPFVNMGTFSDGYMSVEKQAVGEGHPPPPTLYGGYKAEGIHFQSSHGEKACMEDP